MVDCYLMVMINYKALCFFLLSVYFFDKVVNGIGTEFVMVDHAARRLRSEATPG